MTPQKDIEYCIACGQPDHDGPCPPVPCPDCGYLGKGGYDSFNEWDGTCPGHMDFFECPDGCGVLTEFIPGVTFLAGTSDVHTLPNGDPGFPGDPPEYLCADDCEGFGVGP